MVHESAHSVAGRCLYSSHPLRVVPTDADRALPPCDPVRAWLRMGFVISESPGESASNPHICRYTLTLFHTRLEDCVVLALAFARASRPSRASAERSRAPCACHAGILPGSGMASNEIIVLVQARTRNPTNVRKKHYNQNFIVERVADSPLLRLIKP